MLKVPCLAQKGFTLIELAVVIAVIAILAAVAIPRFGNTTATAECSNIKDLVAQLNSGMSLYVAENAGVPTGFTDFVSATALGTPGPGAKTISLVNYGTNALSKPCSIAATSITCTGTFKSYTPTFSLTNGVITLASATPLGTAPACIK